jgi:hypothetical protein
VAHLTETAEGLNIDWVNASFIAEQAYGQYAPDPENPDLAVATDGATGTLALAYQSQDRQGEGVSPNIRVVSRPVVARIPAAGPISFMVAPVWAERVADIGLIVVGQETALTYREVDETGTLAGIHLVRHSGTGWSSPIPLANGSMTGVTYAAGRVEVVGMTDDVKIHVLAP